MIVGIIKSSISIFRVPYYENPKVAQMRICLTLMAIKVLSTS